MDRAKQIWEDLAKDDAYFAVSTHDKFRGSNIDAAAKKEFFESGVRHLDEIWGVFEREFGAKLRPKSALDYGCGVGRILLPLAKKCESVTGVDISPTMLDEARLNLDAKRIDNTSLMSADDFMASDAQRFDFVHSYIVLQHIAPDVGYHIIRTMLERLGAGGFGMIHVTYANTATGFRRLRSWLYRDFPAIHVWLNRLRGRTESPMPMYEYDRDRIISILQENGCSQMSVRATDHGFLGELIYFAKSETLTD